MVFSFKSIGVGVFILGVGNIEVLELFCLGFLFGKYKLSVRIYTFIFGIFEEVVGK